MSLYRTPRAWRFLHTTLVGTQHKTRWVIPLYLVWHGLRVSLNLLRHAHFFPLGKGCGVLISVEMVNYVSCMPSSPECCSHAGMESPAKNIFSENLRRAPFPGFLRVVARQLKTLCSSSNFLAKDLQLSV